MNNRPPSNPDLPPAVDQTLLALDLLLRDLAFGSQSLADGLKRADEASTICDALWKAGIEGKEIGAVLVALSAILISLLENAKTEVSQMRHIRDIIERSKPSDFT